MEVITNDPHVGQTVRCKDDGFTGIIEHIIRDEDGECFSILHGTIARGGVEPHEVEFVKEVLPKSTTEQ